MTNANPPTRLPPVLTFRDRAGALLCRVSNKFRMSYRVVPGLYAHGNPGSGSPVLVTGNYRLSLNALRAALTGRDVWILVVDTKGINVWCAAGKGTFCTRAIVAQINACDLPSVVSHRTLILPQLGASGVAAHKLQKESGFSVKFGPVRALDIKEYLDNKHSATPDMRRVQFSLADRAKLVPMEVIPAIRPLAVFLLIAFVLFGLTSEGINFRQAVRGVWPLMIGGLAAVFAGSLLTPVFLPFIPGCAFTVKGFLTGLIGAVSIILLVPECRNSPVIIAFCLIAVPAYSSYGAFLFTGSTTYTSPAGVKKELKIAWPLYLASAGVSLLLVILLLVHSWGIL